VDVTLDWRIDAAGSQVECSFEGFDEGDGVSGSGWAELGGGKLAGRIAFHLGKDSRFLARKTVEGTRT
jgi:hypothetical protein